MATAVFAKTSGEKLSFGLDFAGRLPTGTAISSATASALNTATEADASDDVLVSTSATVNSTTVTVRIKETTPEGRYRVTLLLTLDNGDLLEDDFILPCTD